MRITICGSCAFIQEMDALRQQLIALGHDVEMPPIIKPGPDGTSMHTTEYYAHKKSALNDPHHWIWQHHSKAITDHFRKFRTTKKLWACTLSC